MTTLLDTLTVKLVGDTSQYVAAFDHAQQKTHQFTNMAKMAMVGVGVAAVAGAAVATKALMDYGSTAVDAASDLSETINKTSVVFGNNAKAVLAWSTTSAQAVGMSRNQALAASSTFGNLFVSMGMGRGVASQMSMDLVRLAADLSSLNNVDPAISLEKLRAGLLGQAEPMQAFGVQITAASTQAKALAMGLAATVDELTPAMLVQARYAQILEQTATAQGDFAETSDGLAGQQRILTANMADMAAAIGEGLLPGMTALTQAGNQLATAVMPHLANIVQTFVTPVLNEAAAALMTLATNMATFLQAFNNGANPVGAFVDAFDLEPIAIEINRVIGWMQHWVNATIMTYNDILLATDQFVAKIAGVLNPVIDALNAVSNAGNDWNRTMSEVNPFAAKNPIITNTMPRIGGGGASTLAINPVQLQMIPLTGWNPNAISMGNAADLPGKAAAEAAEKSASATTRAYQKSAEQTGSAFTTAAEGAGKSIADEVESALRSVPGLFGTSQVTQSDMDKAAAGLDVNYADTWRRRAEDELVNGVDWAEIDPAEVARSVGLDPSVPAKIIIDELNRQWSTGEYFANTDNLKLIDWAAVQAKLDQDAKAALGQSNIIAAAMASGITLESMSPVTSALVTSAKESLASSDLGTVTGTSALAAMKTPTAVTAFENAGAAAFGAWMTGWQKANDEWTPPTPPLPNTPPGGATGEPGAPGGATPPTGGNIPPASGLGTPPTTPPAAPNVPPASGLGTTRGSNSSSGAINITINVNAAGASARAVGNAARAGVLDALRARGV